MSAEPVAYTATAANNTADATRARTILVMATTDCYILISDSTAASAANGTYLPALVPLLLSLPAGKQISAVRVTSSGTLSVTEVKVSS